MTKGDNQIINTDLCLDSFSHSNNTIYSILELFMCTKGCEHYQKLGNVCIMQNADNDLEHAVFYYKTSFIIIILSKVNYFYYYKIFYKWAYQEYFITVQPFYNAFSLARFTKLHREKTYLRLWCFPDVKFGQDVYTR